MRIYELYANITNDLTNLFGYTGHITYFLNNLQTKLILFCHNIARANFGKIK